MGQFEQSSIGDDDLPHVAEFIARSTARTAGPEANTAGQILSRLRWRSIQNPASSGSVPNGMCLRDDKGRISGAIMIFPQLFRADDRTLLGLSMTDYYVNPEARPSGLMRSVLSLSPADFFFSATANAAGGGAMRKLGGVAVPGWDYELLLPLRLGPVLEGFMRRRDLPKLIRHVTRKVGDLADLVRPKPWRAESGLRLRRTKDWNLLAEIADNVRRPEMVTPRRSAEDLRWRFELAPSADSIEVFLLEGGGALGWLATLSHMRGSERSIRCRVLLDHAFSEGTDPAEAVLALAGMASDDTDMITVAGPEEYWTARRTMKFSRRRSAVPRAFVIGSDDGGRPFGEVIELTPAVGDSFT